MLPALIVELRSAFERIFSAKLNPSPLAFPFPPPALTSRKALAPKLKRRANGDVGMLGIASPSSKGLSSTEPEVPEEDRLPEEMLSLRWRVAPSGPGCVGDEEKLLERLSVVTDSLRRCAWAAAVVIGP